MTETLRHYVTLYVPQNTRVGYATYKEAAKDFAEFAGGATVTRGEGWWKGKQELVSMVKSFVGMDDLYQLEIIAKGWARKLIDMGEETVAIESSYRGVTVFDLYTAEDLKYVGKQ